MTAPYARYRATADRLIGNYGGSATLVQKGELTGPPYAPVEGPDVETTVQFIETGYDIATRDDTAVQTGDVIGVMAVPATVTPKPSDKLIINGVQHTFADLKPVQPSADAPVLQFAFQARR